MNGIRVHLLRTEPSAFKAFENGIRPSWSSRPSLPVSICDRSGRHDSYLGGHPGRLMLRPSLRIPEAIRAALPLSPGPVLENARAHV